jgi:hypothetical protein
MGEKELHVFSYENTDEVVAYDLEDAVKVEMEWTGCSREDIVFDGENPFTQRPDDSKLDIRDDEYDSPFTRLPAEAEISQKDGNRIITATCRAWADLNGRGFLCSTEW